MEPFTCCKLEIFIPETHLGQLQEAMQKVDAGHIGAYDCCMSFSPVTGCWRPLEGSQPYVGAWGNISMEPELKVELTCLRERVKETVAAVKEVHPYEEPVINVIPLFMTGMD
ncbi:MAG: cytochrome C biogenesis protein [Clostridium sp.]|nr:cytochrome C biogenesis protein [Clostridium sp.]